MAEAGENISGWIKEQAKNAGFNLVGIAPVEVSVRRDYIREWFAAGRAGTMQWMHRHLDAKVDVRKYMPEARSIICVAINYHFPLTSPPDAKARGRIARYALGDDYHEVFRQRLHKLADVVRNRLPGEITKCCCDTSPVLEREYAQAAGIGWIGKNTCVIHPRMGSWLLLGEVLVSAELPFDEPTGEHCGTCRRCIDACPTRAIIAPYQLDPTKCISYLNIEYRDTLDEKQRRALGDWLFGCDICQEVCPYNRESPEGVVKEFRPRMVDGAVELDEIIELNEDTFREKFRNSAVRRVKLPVLQANANAVSENRRESRSIQG